MARIRGMGLLTILVLVVTLPAWSAFVERFEPVWEKPVSSDSARVEYSKKENVGKTFTDPTTGMEFVLVEGGCYQMGENGGNSNEKGHEVCVDDFYIGKYEVTQGQWQKVTGHNPSYFSNAGDSYPVEQVSWYDVHDYLRWLKLNQESGKDYRLPTEAEWEYAARSGGKREKYAGSDNADEVAWYSGNSPGNNHPVGQKRPNGLGLYDMSGNVSEWTGDWYDKDYYGKSPKHNPSGPSAGSCRVIRGGGRVDDVGYIRSLARNGYTKPETRTNSIGFRLAFPVNSASSDAKEYAVSGKITQTITLKAKNGNVNFEHKQHSERMICQVCHGIGTPGPFDIYKDKAHALCKDCHHKGGQGPTKCGECHMKPNAPQTLRSRGTEAYAATERITQKIVLKAKSGNITFDHKMHGNKLNCQVCHGIGTPVKIGLDKEKAHALCTACHKKGGQGPTRCGDCHKK